MSIRTSFLSSRHYLEGARRWKGMVYAGWNDFTWGSAKVSKPVQVEHTHQLDNPALKALSFHFSTP